MSDLKISKEVLISKFSEQHFKKFLKRVDKSLLNLITEYTEIFCNDSLQPAMLGPRLEEDRNKSVIISKVKKPFKAPSTNKKTFVENPFKESGYEKDFDVKCWFYKDESENILGPFSTTEMDISIHKGKIKAYSLVSFKNNEEFFPVMKMITEVNKKKNPDIFKSKGTYVSYKGRNPKEGEKPAKFPVLEENKVLNFENLGSIIDKTISQNIQTETLITTKPVIKATIAKPVLWFDEPVKKEEIPVEKVEKGEKEEAPLKEEPKEESTIVGEIIKEETKVDEEAEIEKKKEATNKIEEVKEEPIKAQESQKDDILKEFIVEKEEDNDFKLPSSSEEEEDDGWLQIESSNSKQKQKKKQIQVKPSVVGLLPKKVVSVKKEEEEEKVKKHQISKEFNKPSTSQPPLKKAPAQKEEKKEIETVVYESDDEDEGWIDAGVIKPVKGKEKQHPRHEDSGRSSLGKAKAKGKKFKGEA